MKYRTTSDINNIVEELDKDKRFLLNNNVYLQFIDIHNNSIFSTLHKKLELSYTIYVIGIEALKLYSLLEEEDLKIIKKIIDTSSIDYTFCLPKNSNYLPSHLENSTINICVTKYKILNNILYKMGGSLIAFNANIKNDIYYTNIQDVFNEYIDTDILIYKTQNSSSSGLENSILTVKNKKIEILHKGYYDNIFTMFDVIDVSLSYHNNYSDMKFYLVDIIDIPLDETMKHEHKDLIIKQFQNKYLDNSAFIDFNQRMLNFRNMFSIYVDSSCEGNYEEAVYNMYSIIYQIMKSGCKEILINNISYTENDYDIFRNILFDKYNTLSYSKLILPFIMFKN